MECVAAGAALHAAVLRDACAAARRFVQRLHSQCSAAAIYAIVAWLVMLMDCTVCRHSRWRDVCGSASGATRSDTGLALGAAQVIVVEDENGNIVRETMKDTDTLARYKTMHETLVYLSHLDHDDTEKQMLEKLRLQARCCCFRPHAVEILLQTNASLPSRRACVRVWQCPNDGFV